MTKDYSTWTKSRREKNPETTTLKWSQMKFAFLVPSHIHGAIYFSRRIDPQSSSITHTTTRVATAHGSTCKAVKRTRNITNAQDQLTSSPTNPKAETLPNFIQRCLPCKLFTSLEAKSTSSLFLFINDFHDPPNSLMYEFL